MFLPRIYLLFPLSFHRVYIANEGHQSFRLRIDRLLPSSFYRTSALNPFCDSFHLEPEPPLSSFRTLRRLRTFVLVDSLENAADGPALLGNIVYRLPPFTFNERERVFLSYRAGRKSRPRIKRSSRGGKGNGKLFQRHRNVAFEYRNEGKKREEAFVLYTRAIISSKSRNPIIRKANRRLTAYFFDE